jgi:hypothetical protein
MSVDLLSRAAALCQNSTWRHPEWCFLFHSSVAPVAGSFDYLLLASYWCCLSIFDCSASFFHQGPAPAAQAYLLRVHCHFEPVVIMTSRLRETGCVGSGYIPQVKASFFGFVAAVSHVRRVNMATTTPRAKGGPDSGRSSPLVG